MTGTPTRLLYVVHDMSDPSVHRRVRMFRLGGVDDITVMGFRRSAEPVGSVDGAPTIDLGRTEHGRLGDRLRLLAAALLTSSRHRALVRRADLVLARNIEPLLLASLLRRRFARDVPLVYECLDIHPLMVGTGRTTAALRSTEVALVRRCRAVVVSSPAFVTEYFARVHRPLPRMILVENRVLATELTDEQSAVVTEPGPVPGPRPGPPWRIGWLGLIRCSRSLHELTELCRKLPDTVEVVVRGVPIPELAKPLSAADSGLTNFHYGGPYDRRLDLGAIYSDLHFSWTLDMVDSSANSRWLLPNRLYEGGLFQCVPLAGTGVETGSWLASRGVGVCLDEPLGDRLLEYFRELTSEAYLGEHKLMQTVPVRDHVIDEGEAAAIVRDLTDGGTVSVRRRPDASRRRRRCGAPRTGRPTAPG